jgi:nucleoside-diphosphate-sugar epimerase
MMHDEYGVFNWFIRKALEGAQIPVFGDGRILRDFLYVDDLVRCLLLVAVTDGAYGEVFNVGTGVPVSFQSLAETIVKVVGAGMVTFTEFTQERKEVEPGDYYTNISKIRSIVGWESKVALEEGIKKTADFYRAHQKEYW